MSERQERRPSPLTGVGVETEEEEEGLWNNRDQEPPSITSHETTHQVVSVPERLKALSPDLDVRGGVDEEHEEEHDVAGEGSGLGVHDRPRRLLANLRALDVNHVDVRQGELGVSLSGGMRAARGSQ